jgi:Lon protease-like protein
VIPLFPLGTVLFPGLPLPLNVFEPRYRTLMADLMKQPQPWSFGVIAIRAGHEVGSGSVKSLYDVGCSAVIQQVEQSPDGRYTVLLVGDRRFRVLSLDESLPYLRAEVEFLDEPATVAADDLSAGVRQQFADYCEALGAATIRATLSEDPTQLSNVVAATMMIAIGDRQALLETVGTTERLRAEAGLLSRELALIRTGSVPVAQPRLPPQSLN